jgi:hypothetical protein
MSYVEQLERETERTRGQLAATLNELRSAMTPGQVVDQIADRLGFADGDATKLVGNLKRQTVENPLPVALIGAGLAWLAVGGAMPDRAGGAFWRRGFWRGRRAGDWTGGREGAGVSAAGVSAMEAGTDAASASARSLGAAAQDAGEQAGESMERARRSAADMVDTMQTKAGAVMDKAGSAMDNVRETASGGYESLSRGARSTARGVAESTRAARQQTMRASDTLAGFIREQPLVLAGLGLAIGAALGALAPQSESEERMLADAGADLRDNLQEKAEAVRDTAQRAAESAMDAATNTAFEGRSKPPGETRGEGTRTNESTASATDEPASSPAQQVGRGD